MTIFGSNYHRHLPPRLLKPRHAALAHVQRQGKLTTRRLVPLLLGLGVVVVPSVYFLCPDKSRSAPTLRDRPLSATHFTPATITSCESVSPSTKLIEIKIPPHLLPHDSIFRPIWSVFIKDDDIQVERPYTPLEGMDGDGHMLFWIKKYPQGEVGRWLHSKKVGDTIELRGPLTTWLWTEDAWDEVVMISGGTGVTPFYQLLHEVLEQKSDTRPHIRFTLLHSCPSVTELPPPKIMDFFASHATKNPDNFKFHIFVDSLDDQSGPRARPSVPLNVGQIGKTAIEQHLGLRQDRSSWWMRSLSRRDHKPIKPHGRRLILVCGPEPMVNAIAGPYGRNFSQGPVEGVLRELGFTSDQVWKL